jgi:hypothetical protein
VQNLGVTVRLLYNRFGIFAGYKGVTAGLAGLEAQASPATLVKPRVFRVEY